MRIPSEGFSHCASLWQGLKPNLFSHSTARLEAVPRYQGLAHCSLHDAASRGTMRDQFNPFLEENFFG
jgi:hypothetical protein